MDGSKLRFDHEADFKCKVYEKGRVAADPETLQRLAGFSEREISDTARLAQKTHPALSAWWGRNPKNVLADNEFLEGASGVDSTTQPARTQ